MNAIEDMWRNTSEDKERNESPNGMSLYERFDCINHGNFLITNLDRELKKLLTLSRFS